MPHLSRRSLLVGGAGCGLILGGGALGLRLVQDGALPGKYTLATLDGACGSAPPPPRGVGPVQHVASFYSAYRQRVVPMVTLLRARRQRVSASCWPCTARTATRPRWHG